MEAGTQEAKHRLASSLTHDFNNLLTVVIGTSDLMLRDASLSAQQRKDIYDGMFNGTIRKIMATYVYKQGVNFPGLSVIINAGGGGSEVGRQRD